MACATATLIARPEMFPHFLPELPKPFPTLLPKRGPHPPTRMLPRRDLWHELDDLSEEEAELDDAILNIRDRGDTWLIPLGLTLTKREEKNDADESSSERTSEIEEVSATAPDETDIMNEDNDEVDLDASMEDLDQSIGINSDAFPDDDGTDLDADLDDEDEEDEEDDED